MSVRVDIRSDCSRVHGKAVYRRSEFGLLYDASTVTPEFGRKNLSLTIDRQFGIGSGNLFVTADTLTMMFSATDGQFVSLDAYTNYERWTRASKTTPSNIDAGALVLAQSDNDRISLDVVPAYSFNEHESTLFVGLGAKASRYFNVGQDIVVGLATGTLVEIVLTNLQFER
jgi:hypothetical protein